MQFFIIHGSYGNPNENWFPWLKDNLERIGHTVITPEFPTPKNQTLQSWRKVFKKYQDQITQDTIFIGHSLGPAFILTILEQLNIKINASFFVASFAKQLNNKDFDEINKTFVNKQFDWEQIRNNCKQFFIFHSKNDPYVPLKYGEDVANNLQTEIIEINNAGHFNTDSGYKQFPEIIDYINLALRQKKVQTKNKENKILTGLVAYPKKTKKKYKTAILVHGFGVTKTEYGMFDQLAIALNKENLLVYRFDFSGCGESEGNYEKTSLTKLKEDLNSIIKFVKSQKEVQSNELAVLAQSFGTSNTIALAPDVRTIILMGSLAHPHQLLKNIFDKYNQYGISKRIKENGKIVTLDKQFWSDCDSYNLPKHIKKITCPILFIHGTNDTKVPLSEAKILYKNANNPKELAIIKNASHSYCNHRKELINNILRWIKKWLI